MKIRRNSPKACPTSWQDGFVKLLPCLDRLLNHVFQFLGREAREEAVQNAIVLALISYSRLHARRRANLVTVSSLAWYAALQVKAGRVAGGKLNSRDVSSQYAQLRGRFQVERLSTFDRSGEAWIDDMVADKRGSVPDIVAARLDFRTWFGRLRGRTRQIARDLPQGCTTSDAAKKFRVSLGRISQIRRALERSWREFQREALPIAGHRTT